MKLTAVFDIGNTTVHVSLFGLDQPADGRPLASAVLDNHQAASSGAVVDFLQALAARAVAADGTDSDVKLSVICSVVPSLSLIVKAALSTAFGSDPLLLASTMASGLTNHYRNPAGLGADRLAAASGAQLLYPAQNLVIVDSGTATTVDAVDAAGNYRGGYIVPGPGTWLSSLRNNTAQLPALEFDAAAEHGPGLSTAACIVNGLQAAYPAMLGSLVSILQTSVFGGAPARILLTGGWSASLTLPLPFELNPDLVAIGARRMLSLNSSQA